MEVIGTVNSMSLVVVEGIKENLKKLIEKLNGKTFFSEKEKILGDHPYVRSLLKDPKIFSFLKKLTSEQRFYLLSLLAIRQEQIFFHAIKSKRLQELLSTLKEVENTYLEMGGIIGYQYKVYELLKSEKKDSLSNISYHSPNFIDISQENALVHQTVRWGIEHLDQIAEIYVLGGAADRLHLQDAKTKKELPAAMMLFGGKTLLQRLIEDVMAKEYLYEKIFNKKILTPIAIMTSHEKDNHFHVLKLCEEFNWFGRPKESFFFLIQPSVPVVTNKGEWINTKEGKLLLKPGGHGSLWKLAKEKGLFHWFFQKNRKKALVRQINNPIAGIDYGLLAFAGWGSKHNSHFGFATCPRQVHSAEGMNVLIEKKCAQKYQYCLTNIEYCEFEKFGLEDKPIDKSSKYSKFTSNTNLLFIDLLAVEKKVAEIPYPGMLINFKPMIIYDENNRAERVLGGRLETTMQNMADAFVESYDIPLPEKRRGTKKTYVSYNHRHKTISTAKRVYQSGKPYLETPEKCFYDLLQNHWELLVKYCHFTTPELGSFESYLKEGPSFLFSYHPCLGPVYNIISQKLKSGRLHKNSELMLEIAEVQMKDVQIKGSLRIFSNDLSARCIMESVTIENAGIDYTLQKDFWKAEFRHIQTCDVYLGKNSALVAENVTIKGKKRIVVPENTIFHIFEKEGVLTFETKKSTWFYQYIFQKDNTIKVSAKTEVLS